MPPGAKKGCASVRAACKHPITMRILITGICGFVGNTLASGFRQGWPDWEIVGLDNLVRAGSEMNRRALRERNIKLYHGDVRNPSDLEALPRCDWIIEAAANPSVLAGVDGKTSSRQLVEHNLAGTINMLELQKNWRCGFTLLSTSRVYSIRALAAIPMETQGDRFCPSPNPAMPGVSAQGITEEFSAEPPLSLYGACKRASELLACEYAGSFNLPVSVLRCGVLAGAGQFGKIEAQCEALALVGEADQRRGPARRTSGRGGRQSRLVEIEQGPVEGVRDIALAEAGHVGGVVALMPIAHQAAAATPFLRRARPVPSASGLKSPRVQRGC